MYNWAIHEIVKYQYKPNPDRPYENLAIAKIQVEMLSMEVDLISEMVHSNKLKTDRMLIIDGSLQFSGIKEQDEHIFQNVIGISKTFNPRLQGILKTKKKEIGHYLTNLMSLARNSWNVLLAKGCSPSSVPIATAQRRDYVRR